MPDFVIDNQVFYNPVDYALKKIGGTWKMPVLWRIREKRLRYSELLNQIPHISQKMLTQTLRQLEKDGFIVREVFAEIPPRTEYAITDKGKKAVEIIIILRDYGLDLMKDSGIDYQKLIQAEKKGN